MDVTSSSAGQVAREEGAEQQRRHQLQIRSGEGEHPVGVGDETGREGPGGEAEDGGQATVDGRTEGGRGHEQGSEHEPVVELCQPGHDEYGNQEGAGDAEADLDLVEGMRSCGHVASQVPPGGVRCSANTPLTCR